MAGRATSGGGAVDRPRSSRADSSWRSVAIPREHGGWGLTLEPVLLGLLVAWSVPGVLLGVVAFGAFLVRTPLKTVAVDRRRGNWRDRSTLALRIAAVELLVIGAALLAVVVATGWRWAVPVAMAVPLVAVEAWFDVRSRSRRLLPELCGAVGVASVVAAIVLADRDEAALALALWLVLAARSTASIPFVRTQVARQRHPASGVRGSDVAQIVAVVLVALAVGLDDRVVAGSIGLAVIAALQVASVRRPVPAIKVLGVQQMMIGIVLAVVTAIGVHVA